MSSRCLVCWLDRSRHHGKCNPIASFASAFASATIILSGVVVVAPLGCLIVLRHVAKG